MYKYLNNCYRNSARLSDVAHALSIDALGNEANVIIHYYNNIQGTK